MPRPSANYWQDYPSGGTPRSATNLNGRETAILDYTDEKVSLAPAAAQVITAPNALVQYVDGKIAGDTYPRLRLSGGAIMFGSGTADIDTSISRAVDANSLTEVRISNLATAADGTRVKFTGGINVTGASDAARRGNSANGVPLYSYSEYNNTFTSSDYAAVRGSARMRKTDTASHTTLMSRGIDSITYVGDDGSLAKGNSHAFTATVTITNSTSESEHAGFVGFIRYDGGVGAPWMTDFNLHGAITTQQRALIGVSMFINNHYDGSPSIQPSFAFAASTKYGDGGGRHPSNPTTYSLDIGYWVVGTSGTSSNGAGRGYEVAFKAGHGNHPRTGAALTNGPWGTPASRLGTGLVVDDYEVNGIVVNSRKSGTGSGVKLTGGTDLELVEAASAPAATANSARVYAEDNGSGKTRLMVRFGSGASQQIALEP